ncbi:rRNA pseudouridine synthase [Anaplasmataceae bacterium AB001_6]|nr:rRNA pseudouridine synthase [Anaplasmataceae bacterium AB001_6]
MRIAKYIANCGYCSRRQAEKLIYSKKIKIDNKIVESPLTFVNDNNVVKIDEKIIQKSQTKIVLFYKPTGFLTTHKDPQGRKSIFDILPKDMKNLIFIGRLDMQSEGLIILTNNRKIANKLTNPKNEIERQYKVKIFGTTNFQQFILKLKHKIEINDILYKKIDVNIIKRTKNNTTMILTLIEGKNREIRNIMSYFDLKISKLIRIKFDHFSIENLKIGEYKVVSRKHVMQYENLLFP